MKVGVYVVQPVIIDPRRGTECTERGHAAQGNQGQARADRIG